jgi:ABC-type glycerol-3-phosphate transport system substrate-binding protein
MKSLHDRGFVSPTNIEYESGNSLFTNEGAYRIQQYQQIGIDAEPAPPVKKETTATVGYGTGFVIPKSAPEQEDIAWDFIVFACKPNWVVNFAKKTGFQPGFNSTYKSEEWNDYLSSCDGKTRRQWKEFQKYVEYATIMKPNPPNHREIRSNIVSKYLEMVWADRLTPEEALEEMEKEITAAVQ